MFSTVIKRVVATFIIAGSLGASAAPPKFLQDPLLGLRYQAGAVLFEPLPASVAALCPVLQGGEAYSGVWFIFAKSADPSGRTFYVVNGYEIRHRPAPPQFRTHFADGFGVIFSVAGQSCSVIDNDARQAFDERIFNEELPQSVVAQLAADFATRMAKAFGGRVQLNAELRNQRVAVDDLPVELRAALSRP